MKQKIRGARLLSVVGMLALTASAFALQTERAFTPVVRHDLEGRVTGTIAPDPDGVGPLKYLAMRNTYDPRGLLVRVESGELGAWLDETVQPKDWGSVAAFTVLSTTEYAHDDFGRTVSELRRGTDGAIVSLVQLSYMRNYLVRCRAVRMNPAVFAAPPANVCVPGPEGPHGPDRITRYTHDALDQVLTVERAVGVPGLQQTHVANTYNHRLLASQTDANGNRTEFRYNDYGRLMRRVFPSPGTPGVVNESDFNSFLYDRNGNPTFERKRDERYVFFEYDAENRLIRKDLSDNTHAGDGYYAYDLRGLALYSRFGSDAGPGETLSYDGFGALRTRTTNLGATTRQFRYSYDANGNRTRVAHPDGHFFSYEFDGLDRVIGLASSNLPADSTETTSVMTVHYGRDGRRLQLARPGAANTTYVPDNALRLARYAQGFTSAGDSFENNFSYNPANQIERLGQGNDLYNFREVANRTGAYVPNGLNQYTTINGQPIQYDANGNLRGDGELAYTYDMENRLVAASGTVAGVVTNASFVWDPNGRLHQLTINGVATEFLYDGGALAAEYSGGTLQRRYVHGDQVDEPWVQYNDGGTAPASRRFLIADHQGSVVAHADNSGRLLNRLAYDSYGIPAASNIDRFGYTGQAWIRQLGLYHYKARMYHPKLGRFLQTDPIGYRDDMNLYAYVGNDSINATDSTGMLRDGRLEKALARAGGRYIQAAITSQLDSPAPGPGDVVAAVLAVGTTAVLIYDLGKVVFTDDEAPTKADSNDERVTATDRAEGIDRSASAAQAPTVLGKFPGYIILADQIGARRFSIPPSVWNRMSKDEQWAANQKFLDRAIARGDMFLLANRVRNINDVSGSFRQELDYLVSRDFRLSADGTQMVR